MASKIDTKGRPMGSTEQNWCRAVTSGTGITVLTLKLSKRPNVTLLRNAIQKLQNAHPILKSKLHYNPSTNSFSFITPLSNHPQVDIYDLSSTQVLIKDNGNTESHASLQAVLERELDQNPWSSPESYSEHGTKMFYISLYVLEKEKWVVALRLHPAVCDRTTAVGLLRELRELMEKGEGEGNDTDLEIGKELEVSLGIEDLIPRKKIKKTIWAHGLDTLSYSVNSLRLTNMGFIDVKGNRRSRVVRFQMSSHDTTQILQGCKSKGIKLCSVLSSSALLSADSLKYQSDGHGRKYGVITLIDCRPLLSPSLSTQNYGFYHSAILNTHVVKGGETLWDLAIKNFKAFANSKNYNKHFSDMADLNFLMRKAIDNPSLTQSSSLRTSLITVFDDHVIDGSDTGKEVAELGLEDYMGCASVHGVGPSIAIFDTIQDGRLDCVCVYPSPLHSREQMQEMVDEMKKVLVQGCKCVGITT